MQDLTGVNLQVAYACTHCVSNSGWDLLMKRSVLISVILYAVRLITEIETAYTS